MTVTAEAGIVNVVADIPAFTSATVAGSTVHLLNTLPDGAAAATTATVVPTGYVPLPLPFTTVTAYDAPLVDVDVLVLVLVLVLELVLPDVDDVLVLEVLVEAAAPEVEVEELPLDAYRAIADVSAVTFEKSLLHLVNV